MKTLRVFGWAVIFTVTLLLAACASQTPKMADTDVMSGPDTTTSQAVTQMHEDSAIVVSQDWLDERERAVEQRELDLELRENALVIQRAWLDERELQLAQRGSDIDRRVNSLAINQAWLNEREMRLAREEDMLADSPTKFIKLAGADSILSKAVTSPVRVESGRCYASVVYPAEYKTVAVIKPIEVPKGENLPTLYQTVTEKVKVTDEQRRWEEILCEDSMTECRIIEVQRALYRGGYDPGPIDGIVGRQTMAAVNAFQKDFNLTVANHLTVETVEALDANF